MWLRIERVFIYVNELNILVIVTIQWAFTISNGFVKRYAFRLWVTGQKGLQVCNWPKQGAKRAKKVTRGLRDDRDAELMKKFEDAEKRGDHLHELTQRFVFITVKKFAIYVGQFMYNIKGLNKNSSENQVIRYQALIVSLTGKSLSAKLGTMIIQKLGMRTMEKQGWLHLRERALGLPNSREPESEEKPQKSLNEKQQVSGFDHEFNCTICSKQERLALLKFKHSVEDISDMLSSWVGNDCCQWERVHCDKVTGRVESLYLRGSVDIYDLLPEVLIGYEMSSSLRHLRNLKFLDLSANDFGGGQIPEFIGSFKQLSYLNLSNANFSDDMSWISGLSLLKYLDLSYVDLSKAQNRGMVFYMMPSLVKLSLSGCSLTNADLGTLSNSSTTLANIKHLDLGNNFFKGQFPGFFQNMTSLESLDLSYFDFSLSWLFSTNFLSTIHYFPKMHFSSCGLHNMHLSPNHLNFSKISIIQHLDLSRNLIEGRFPSALTNMSSLLSLDLAGNKLNSLVPIMPNLLRLDLSWNNFEHIEDVGIWRQCHLKELSVSYNHFRIKLIDSPKNVSECSQYAFERLNLQESLKGAFPADSLGRMANLRVLTLSGNKLTGPIPESLGRLRLLEELILSDNQLTGPIPESIGRLAALIVLDLSNNQLTGHVPTSLGRLVSLQVFKAGSNSLNGTIPVSIGQLTKLRELNISFNSLQGVITEAHFANLSMLKYLDAFFNSKLTFNVSREWKPPFQLIFADLSIKIINGFPQWLRTQKRLKVLFLSNASITGPLPTWFQKMSVIDFLDLSHNNLTGPLTNLPNKGSVDVPDHFVKVLSLRNNLFNESIPISLCRWTDLDYLDLSRNRLTGRIPECLGNMRNLVIMQLSSNQLSGVIPRKLNGMITMNLASTNYLDEGIPVEETLIQVIKGASLEYTTTFRYVINMDLSSNNLVGEIPIELMSLSALMGLNLSNNHLSGGIPDSIGKMKALNSLDFSGNQLTGPIPPSIGALNFLSYLNLSHNNLSGRIPTGSQLQTLTDPSIYVGNRDLCGAPLPKNCSNNEDQTTMHTESNKVWFYMDIMCGFAAGFWGVIGVLLFKKHWRHKLFMFAEETVDKIYVAVVLRVDKMKRGRESA
ncbi:leucine-rich repeat protein [Artemisia annua]|uniref:Leucine-rich repeat protein n=1 Tax=Artemisia annua TaxID=35608 RepID=A0A2U1NGX2_ARTAN|nr:leucine-rich repeat protein [Artemisia annua]